MWPRVLVALLLASSLAGCVPTAPDESAAPEEPLEMPTPTTAPEQAPAPRGTTAIGVTSPAFENGAAVPTKHTCEGDDVSPALAFSDVSEEVESLALIMHDPDAPREGGFLHWTFWNLDASLGRVPEGARMNLLGAAEGANDAGEIGYKGPCPPSGTHRYFFYVYGLDTRLDLEEGASVDALRDAMQGHVVSEGQLMGTYARVTS